MNLQQLELVLAIADTGSIHSACRSLNKTQPTLTKALSQLEKELGTPLFVRSSRGMRPTEAGAKVIKRAYAICTETNRLKDEVHQILGGTQGSASVCVSPFIAYAVMPQVLVDYKKTWPHIEVTVVEEVHPNSLARLREGRVDMVVGPSPEIPSREFTEEPFYSTDLMVITSASSQYRDAKSLIELLDIPWASLSSKQGVGRLWTETFTDHGLPTPSRVTWLDSFVTFLEFTKQSGCCGLFPQMSLDRFPFASELVSVVVKEPPKIMTVSLFTRSEDPLPPASEALANLIRLHANAL
jgi:DNA-binding transcriptional LysR family regulator